MSSQAAAEETSTPTSNNPQALKHMISVLQDRINNLENGGGKG